MNPYNTFPYIPYAQQPQPVAVQHLPQQVEPKVVTYTIDTAEQLSSITPMPNTIYLGLGRDGDKIFQRRMNNDGLTEVKTFVLMTEQTKKSEAQEILERIKNIENKLNIGGKDESTNVA